MEKRTRFDIKGLNHKGYRVGSASRAGWAVRTTMPEQNKEYLEADTAPEPVPPAKPRLGVHWVSLAIWCAAVAACLAFTHYRFALGWLLVLLAAVPAFFNVVYLAAARVLGMEGVEEFAIGVGPVLAQVRIRKTECRLNWFLLGGCVKFPGQDETTKEPRGFMLLHPIRQALVYLSAPVACAMAGWLACELSGVDRAASLIIHWFRSGNILEQESWRQAVRTLLYSMSSTAGLPRAAGMIMLGFGLLNLIPFPALSGGIALKILVEYTIGRKMSNKLWIPILYVGLFALLALYGIALAALATVLFKG